MLGNLSCRSRSIEDEVSLEDAQTSHLHQYYNTVCTLLVLLSVTEVLLRCYLVLLGVTEVLLSVT